jgi:hypothetical protein
VRRGRGWLRGAILAAAVVAPGAVSAGVYAEARALNVQLLSHDSATAVLAQWCADHHLADPPTIVARRLPGDKPADAQVRALLHAAPGEPIRYRRVALVCGVHTLSTADNWYRPNRLTAAMNEELDGTDHPFGTVVKALGFHRVRLSARLLVSPGHPTADAVIRHEAVLEIPDGTPFSLVIETYGREAVVPH